ncbi:hypothetical protein KDL45_04055 [bacterium]|nr:hypothetical protein [bacterium]
MRLWIVGVVFALGAMLVLGAVACGDDDDDDDDAVADDDSVDDDDTADDDTSDDDTGDDDTEVGEKLFAAAGSAIITPNATNHPETVYLGGLSETRVMSSVHDDLTVQALVLNKGDEKIAIVAMDLVTLTLSWARKMRDDLAVRGFDPHKVFIAATHVHEAPDTVGVYGPSLFESGVSPEYMEFLRETVVDLVDSLDDRMTAVSMTAGSVDVNDPLSNFPALIDDFRKPYVVLPRLSAARFVDDEGETVATLVNWNSHPEIMLQGTELSADFPRWAREKVTELFGGTTVYITGAVGGLSSPTGVDVPARDENGDPIDDGGEPLYWQNATWDKTRSLGYVLGEYVQKALEGAAPVEDPEVNARSVEFLLPVDNAVMRTLFKAGLVEYEEDDLVEDHPDFCGGLGCAREMIGVIRVGPVAIVTSPGETFPETVVGRPESTFDYGGEWGEFTFPAIEGYETHLDAPVKMHMGLCGDGIGYIIPETDYHEGGHPDFYEEFLTFSKRTEALYRQAVIDLVSEP